MAKFFNRLRCTDCNAVVDIPEDLEENEIVSCPSCGCEYIYRNSIFEQLDLDQQDDWGE
jgi:predicted RNA-binding Zn-ribbon protein involved in translation (DUF1610 family)